MFAEKHKNTLKVVLSSEESCKINIFETIINPSSKLSKKILSGLFLSACKKVNCNYSEGGNYKVEISADSNGNVTVVFTKSVKPVCLKPYPVIFKFDSCDNMLECIKTLFNFVNCKANLYFYNGKYYIFAYRNKKLNCICKEFATKQNSAKIKAVLTKKARLIDTDVINNFGKKLNVFKF